MSARHTVAFLVDVDDTLLDNDGIRDDLREHLGSTYGTESGERYWTTQERRFVELGYRDYLGAAQEWWEGEGFEPRLLDLSRYLLDYPFADRLYPDALQVLTHLRRAAPTVVVTDGDAVYQPWKVHRAGISEAVAGDVLVYVHKELELDDLERRYPAERYVLVDDKLRILSAAKEFWGERVITVFPRQGQFANDPAIIAAHTPADVTVDRVGELLDADPEAVFGVA
jgi:FMN phosphatase YigB (HAD superfamily)